MLVAESTIFREALAHAERAATRDAAVVLCGEPGTGKSAVARLIHGWSPQRGGPFVRAPRATERALRAASGGTLYVDCVEAGALPELIGMSPPDVRLIGAVSDPLVNGQGGPSVYPITLPPLRDRPEDLGALAAHFARPLTITEGGQALLRRHTWPGNVRELRVLIERVRANATGPLDEADFEPLLPTASASLDLKKRVQAFELGLFREALRRTSGKKSAAAQLLGIDPSNWAYHAKRLGLR